MPLFIEWILKIIVSVGILDNHKFDRYFDSYGIIFGSIVTLLGVKWTLDYTEKARKADQRRQMIEHIEESRRQEKEKKELLSIQYRPILGVYCTSDTLELFREHPDVILLNEYKGYTIIGNVNLSVHPLNNSRGNNCVIAVNLLNIGRGEALNIEIKTTVRGNNDITPQIGNTSYPQINLSQGLLLISIVDSEVVKKWELPVMMNLIIRYNDLVGRVYEDDIVVKVSNFNKLNNNLFANFSDIAILGETKIID